MKDLQVGIRFMDSELAEGLITDHFVKAGIDLRLSWHEIKHFLVDEIHILIAGAENGIVDELLAS